MNYKSFFFSKSYYEKKSMPILKPEPKYSNQQFSVHNTSKTVSLDAQGMLSNQL
jgi:hypothetical protein